MVHAPHVVDVGSLVDFPRRHCGQNPISIPECLDDVNFIKPARVFAFRGSKDDVYASGAVENTVALLEQMVADPANTIKSADQRVIDKPILHFEGKDRGLVLNKTNARAIARRHGPTMDEWIGKEIQIYQARVDAFGERDVPAVRVWGAPVTKKRGGRR